MLHRAANKAYSWWWASHVRTKQSKWLEENLHEVEDIVGEMLKIIEEDGETFAQKAEMYYQKRPELIGFVEETYRAYRALAERYDSLSKDLQSANRTIASVLPEQVPIAMEEDDDENVTRKKSAAILRKSEVPRKPFPKREFMSSPRTAANTESGLSKDEALDEIDKLQKEILALQTEKEFIRSSYERGCEKYWQIEDQINEKQKKVCNLQDEFGIGNYIEDNEARSLMVSTALRSCQDTLVKLQEEQETSDKEAKVESMRVTEAHRKFEELRKIFLPKLEQQEQDGLENLDQEMSEEERAKREMETRNRIKKLLEVDDSSLITMPLLADKIDELVQKVVNLETEVYSQGGMVKRLRSETDGLQGHVGSLEEEKEALIEDSDKTQAKMTVLEEELFKVKDLVKTVIEQNNNLKTNFTEANCNLDHLSEKLECVKMDQDDETKAISPENENKDSRDGLAPGPGEENQTEEKENDVMSEKPKESSEEEKENDVMSEKPKASSEEEKENDVMSEKPKESSKEEKVENEDLSEPVSRTLETDKEEPGIDGEENQPNGRKMFKNGLEDKEKILMEEYTSVLGDYKDVKQKLNEVEQKNKDGFFELTLQIRELKTAVASRDGEIQFLREKISSPCKITDEDQESTATRQEGSISCMSQPYSAFSSPTSHHERVMNSYLQQQAEYKERAAELKARRGEEQEKIIQMMGKGSSKNIRPVQSHPHSAGEEKIRSDIDGLLEENLEFWLRFSTCFHQLQKYQASVQDLKSEISKLAENKVLSPKSKAAEARPIFLHLREIRTELTLWLENNTVLRDEVETRHSFMCRIQEEVSRLTTVGTRAEESELSQYQAARFHGELLSMKQENNKVSNELKAGFVRVNQMKLDVEKAMEKLDEDYGITASTQRSGARIPLRSFLFGVKLKARRHSRTASMFSCIAPSNQYTDEEAPIEHSD